MARRSQREQWQRMKLYSSILFSCFIMIAADEVRKSFDQNLTLPCSGCDHSQDCYSVINNNTRSTGSSITQSGSILLLSHTWNVYGSVCCGSDLEQLLCHTVCPPQYERCEGCELVLSTNLSSVNDTIRVTKGEEITFTVTFTHQDHNAFTFTVNESISHPNFICTLMRDTNVLTKTLMVQYRCVAMELGTYPINSYVTFCNFDYPSPTVFTVIVENTTSMASPTPVPEHSTSSTSSMMLANRTVSSGTQPVQTTVKPSTVVPLIPTTVISSVLPTATTNISVTDATEENQDEGSGTIAIVIGIMLILVAVIVIVVLLLVIIKCISRRHDEEQQPSAGGDDHLMGVTQYDSSRAVSITGNTSTSGSYITPSDFSTPYTGSAVSISLAYPVPVTSEPTSQVPEDANTSHQFREDTV